METLTYLAARLDEAAVTLTGAAHTLVDLGPGSPAFGADAPGLLGDLGRALHGQWITAVGTRAREAAATAARLADAAAAVRAVAGAYADADHAAHRRQPEAP